MKTINLISKLQNIRNTVRPETPTPSQIKRKRQIVKRAASSLIIAFLAVYLFWLVEFYQPFGVAAIEMSPVKSIQISRATQEGKDKRAVTDVVKNVGRNKKNDSPQVEKKNFSRLAPIISRPVAKDASFAKGVDPREEWSIRFAVCVHKKSCDEVSERLRKRGVSTYVKQSMAKIVTHRVVIGPWKAISLAKRAQKKLRAYGVESSIFSAEVKHYLTTNHETDIKQIEKTYKRVRSMGYRAEKTSSKAPKKLYKVYKGTYKNKHLAGVEMQRLINLGIKCFLERQG